MTTKKSKVDIEVEVMKQEIITIIQNTTDKVRISRVYESLTGHSTQSHPRIASQIRVVT